MTSFQRLEKPAPDLGPHGIDVAIPRGLAPNRLRHKHMDRVEQLKAEVMLKIAAEADERAKQTVNANRASGSNRAGQ